MTPLFYLTHKKQQKNGRRKYSTIQKNITCEKD